MISHALSSGEFVGRHDELAFLHREFARAEERVRFVLVEGEAGIGKTRLVKEFAQAVAAKSIVAWGACSENIRAPYFAFDELLRTLDRRRLLRSVQTSGVGSYGEERYAYFSGVADLLHREAERRPLLVVVEDAHWADSATLELLRYLLERLRGAPAFFIVTLRVEGAARNPMLSALRSAASRAGAATLQLRALKRNEIKHLVQLTLRERDLHLAPEVVSQIEVLAEGNPLFAEELARIAIESGGEMTLHAHLPLSLQTIFSERIAPLTQAERDTLVRAAIIGQEFDAKLLSAIAGCSLEEVLHVMQRAVERALLTQVRGEPMRFRFHHELIRRALADQLVLALAGPLHVRIAEELEARDDAGPRAAELAYHWSEARVAEKARFWNAAAAEAAWNVYAYRDAIRFYSAALRWEYPPGPDRAAICERLGTLLYIDGCGDEPARWFARSREEFEAAGDRVGAARALLHLSDQSWVDAKTEDGLRAASEAAATLERLGERQTFVQATIEIARFSNTLGNARQAQAHLRVARRYREQFDELTSSAYHEVRGETNAMHGRTAESLADFIRAAELGHRIGSGELIAQIENNFGLCAADLGELAIAALHHRIALDEARKTGLMWRIAYCAVNYARTLLLQGRLADARTRLWEALESGTTTATFRTKAASVGIPLGIALADNGLIEACADESVLQIAERSREIQRVSSVGSAFAELRISQKRPDEAAALIARAIRMLSNAHRSWDLFLSAARFGSSEDVALARTMVSAAPGRPRVQRAYALLFAAITAANAAEVAYASRLGRAAAREFARTGNLFHQAMALETAGDLDGARRLYERMLHADALSRLASRGEPRGVDALTPRQRQIANLAAAGRTNREIAEALSISEHTVEHHLSDVFARMNIRSRVQLAAVFAKTSI